MDPLQFLAFLLLLIHPLVSSDDFRYYGCYLNFQANTTYKNSTNVTSSECTRFCQEQGYMWASISVKQVISFLVSGLGRAEVHCSCGNELPDTQLNASYCNYECPGNDEMICGGSNSSIYAIYKIIDKGKQMEAKMALIIGAVVGTLLAVIVIVGVIIIITLRKRKSKCQFEPVSKKERTGKKGDISGHQRKSKPNKYVHTEQSNIEEQPKYDYPMVETSIGNVQHKTDKNKKDKMTKQTKYENTDMEKTENEDTNTKGDFYVNVEGSEFLNYEIPEPPKDAKHTYLSLETPTGDEDANEEYEAIMPRNIDMYT